MPRNAVFGHQDLGPMSDDQAAKGLVTGKSDYQLLTLHVGRVV